MMKRGMITLILIVAMILTVSVAMAASFSATGNINSANGWSTSGDWQNYDGAYTLTDSSGSASHPISGASGQFTYTVSFRIGESDNYLKIGVVGPGGEHAIEYSGGNFKFNGAVLGPKGDGNQFTLYTATISSADGSVWHASVYGYESDVTVGGAPTSVTLALTKTSSDPLLYSPIIATVSMDYATGSGPTPTPTGTPTGTPTEQPPATYSPPQYDQKKVQAYYDKVYPLLSLGPNDKATINPDGTYTIVRGNAQETAPATFAVSGAVRSASGVPISGANVVIGDQPQKTDSAGQYKFDGLPKGNYEIAVSAAGYASKTQSIDVSADVKLNFALEAASAANAGTANAANETATATPAAATAAPAPTQTKSPGFEGIFAVLAVVGVAGALIYLNKKR